MNSISTGCFTCSITPFSNQQWETFWLSNHSFAYETILIKVTNRVISISYFVDLSLIILKKTYLNHQCTPHNHRKNLDFNRHKVSYIVICFFSNKDNYMCPSATNSRFAVFMRIYLFVLKLKTSLHYVSQFLVNAGNLIIFNSESLHAKCDNV